MTEHTTRTTTEDRTTAREDRTTTTGGRTTTRGQRTKTGARRRTASRRDVLKATGAGVGALALGLSTAGTAAAEPQIPTPRLHVDGNLVRDEEGNRVTLRGLNVPDPKRVDTLAPMRGKNAAQMIETITDQGDGWYPRVIRIPVQPIDIGEHTSGYVVGPATPPAFTQAQLDDYLETHLDPLIELCAQRGVYAIVDFHRHWTDGETEWDGSWASTSGEPHEELQQEVDMFWDTVAPRYADDTHVLYEVYNEPTKPGMWEDPKTTPWVAERWFWWVNMAQPWLDTIRSHAPDTLVLMGSPSWTQSPEGALITPEDIPDYMQEDFVQFDDPSDNLAYTFHIYPGHNSSKALDWEDAGNNGEGVDGVYEEFPLFVTEFGWDNTLDPGRGQHDEHYPLQGTTSGFGEPFVEWLESSDAIHWTAWCADIWWSPTMFDQAFEGTDVDIENAYEEEIPVDCPDLPCEWHLLGEDVGDYDDHMGAFIKVTLAELRNDGVPSGETTPTCDGIEVGSYCAQDPSGDGKYTDVNGNGGNDFDDVVTFFEEMQGDGVQNNVDAFDFNDNGTIDFDDVVALFERV